ncbi:MAG TPA: lantibiotic dehydratase [Terriglobales bacterium]|nr:lantibiotic dehydratase [Terriglobales bacterium]
MNPDSQTLPLYQPAQSYLVRTPTLPIDHLTVITNLPDAELLKSLTLFERKAILIRSLSLHEDIERINGGGAGKEEVVRTVYRYLVRMATRATPYGMFATATLGAWGNDARMHMPTTLGRTKTRLDATWLRGIVNLIESIPTIRHGLHFFWHEGARFQGGWTVLYDLGPGDEPPAGKAEWIGRSRALEAVAKAAKKGASFANLMLTAAASMPATGLVRPDDFLDTLWKKGFLISELRHPVIKNPVSHLSKCLGGVVEARPYLLLLERLQATMSEIDAAPSKVTIKQLYDLICEMRDAFKTKSGNYIQVDTAAVLMHPTIPHSVGFEVCKAAEVLLRLSRFPRGQTNFNDYQRRFRERYGLGIEVPLLEVIDPVRGLGMPDRIVEDERAAQRDSTLLRIASNALQSGNPIVELTDAMINQLTTSNLADNKLPRTFDLVVTVGASSLSALSDGDFTIAVGPGVGSLVGGKHFGRFVELIGRDSHNLLREIAQVEQAWDPHQLEVELVFSPADDNHLNVCSRSVSRMHAVYYGVPPMGNKSHRVMLSDLVVGMRESGFYVRWTRENVEIRPGAWHMLNPRLAPDPLRFLVDLYLSDQAALTGFSWGVASQLPWTPRVTRERVVLCPAQWKLVVGSDLQVAATRAVEWEDAFTNWRTAWKVPQFVFLGRGDKRVLLDLYAKRDLNELRQELRKLSKGNTVVISEVLPPMDKTWLEGPDGHYLCELVVPLLLRGQGEWKQCVASQNPVCSVEDAEKAPGSEWLYVELYSPVTHLDALIAGPVSHFANDLVSKGLITKWFFIKYSEGGHHVRFRVNGEKAGLAANVLPRLSEFIQKLRLSGWISRFEYRTYQREVARYGGLLSLERAECLFADDSVFCAILIDALMRNRPSIDRRSIVAWTAFEFLQSMGFSNEALDTIVGDTQVATRAGGLIYRKDKQFLRCAFSGIYPNWLDDGLTKALEAYRGRLAEHSTEISRLASEGIVSRSLTSMAASFVHMHCNRILGIDSHAEHVAMNILMRSRESIKKCPINVNTDICA